MPISPWAPSPCVKRWNRRVQSPCLVVTSLVVRSSPRRMLHELVIADKSQSLNERATEAENDFGPMLILNAKQRDNAGGVGTSASTGQHKIDVLTAAAGNAMRNTESR